MEPACVGRSAAGLTNRSGGGQRRITRTHSRDRGAQSGRATARRKARGYTQPRCRPLIIPHRPLSGASPGGDQGVAGQELRRGRVVVAGAQVVAAALAVQVLPGVA
jgi:hypothetical protein